MENPDRRKFIGDTALTIGALGLSPLALQALGADPHPHPKNSYTVQDIIDLILREGNLTPKKDTVDTIKAGRPDQVVTGIVTTMFPTISVIQEAVKLKANFIIAHEPSFYNHRDDPDWVKDNSVVKQKKALLEKDNIAIWRFHDYCHSLSPDAISYGLAKKMGWLPYFKTGQAVLTIPRMTLKQLIQRLKSSLQIAHVRVIGDPQQPCERVAVMPGAAGGQRQVFVAETQKPDVLIVGEISEWETGEYARDAKLLGSKTALVVLGHSVSEEPGMDWVADWLQPKIPDIKVTHVASGDPFTWL